QFQLQSRGVRDGGQLGPYVSGSVTVNDGALTATLHNFHFSDDIRQMLPHDVREWWQRHELAGGLETQVNYTPPNDTGKGHFRIQTDVTDVQLAVHAEEWSSREEVRHFQNVQAAVQLMRRAYRVAGFAVLAGPAERPGIVQSPPQ